MEKGNELTRENIYSRRRKYMKQDIITNLKVKDNEIRVMRVNNEDYISLTSWIQIVV